MKTQTLRRIFREVAILQSLATDRLTAVLPPELTVQQFSLMSHLVNTQNGPESPGDLAQIFQVSRPAMTQLLQRLQARGEVTLIASEVDGRARVVHLTAKGQAVYEGVFSRLENDLSAIASLGDESELNELHERLHNLRRFMERQAGR